MPHARQTHPIPFLALLIAAGLGAGCQDKDGSIDDTGEPACFPPVVSLTSSQAPSG